MQLQRKNLKLINEVKADTSVEKHKEILEKAYKSSKTATATYIETTAVTSGKPTTAKSTKTSTSTFTMTTPATSKKTTTSTSCKTSTSTSTKTTVVKSTKTTVATSGDTTTGRYVTVTSTSAKTTGVSAKTKLSSKIGKNNHLCLSACVDEIILLYSLLFLFFKKTFF